MKVSYAVTFEFIENPPITERGQVSAISVRTCVARALDEATEKNPNLKWNSISVLIQREEP